MCVCVCVWEREREREGVNHDKPSPHQPRRWQPLPTLQPTQLAEVRAEGGGGGYLGYHYIHVYTCTCTLYIHCTTHGMYSRTCS